VPWLRKMSRTNRFRRSRGGEGLGKAVVGRGAPHPGPPADWPIINMQAI